MEMYFHFLPAFHKLTCSLTSWDWDHVSPRAAFSSLTLSPQVESVSSEQFIQPVYLELLSPSLRNLRKYVHHGTKMQMWPVLQPDLYLPHPYLAGICFFPVASSVHVLRERSSGWPLVPAEKGVSLDAPTKLPLLHRKRLFLSNTLCQSHGFHFLRFPEVCWLSL